MCEKAEEIQKKWKPKVGDRRIDRRDRSEGFIESQGIDYIRSESGLRMINIYIPTQEQLQEMVREDYPCGKKSLLGGFHSWILADLNRLIKDEPISELWFTFVMKEKYNKIWIGDDWK